MNKECPQIIPESSAQQKSNPDGEQGGNAVGTRTDPLGARPG